MSHYNHLPQYSQQRQQPTGSYYSSTARATNAESGHYSNTHNGASITERYGYAAAPAYGAYNNNNNNDLSATAPAPQPQSYRSQYTQSQHLSAPASYARPGSSSQTSTSTSTYYNRPTSRPNASSVSSPSSHQVPPSQSQTSDSTCQRQRNDGISQHGSISSWNSHQQRPHQQQPQHAANQYSNVRSQPQGEMGGFQDPINATATFVDPSQVYDRSHEFRRQAQLAEAEAAKRAKEQEAARKAEEARQAEHAEREREREREASLAEARRLAEQGAQKNIEKAKRKPRASRAKRPKVLTSEIPPSEDQMKAAATTLMGSAHSGQGGTSASTLEAQMKAMFSKMREFNQVDPAMLSRLWQQERDAHLAREASASTPRGSPKTPTKRQGENLTNAASTVTQAANEPPKSGFPGPTQAPNPASQPVMVTAPEPAAASTSAAAPKRGTVWPAGKKEALAEAASNLLRTMAGNDGKTIPAVDITSILADNPTYPRLCDFIEERGVKVDRSSFAKALLAAVPDVTRPKASTTSTDAEDVPLLAQDDKVLAAAEKKLLKGVNMLAKKAGRPPKSGETPGTTQAAVAGAPTLKWVTPRVLDAADLGDMSAVKRFIDRQRMESRPPASPAAPTIIEDDSQVAAGPSTKQDLARKRNFNELIDLSKQLSDDDETLSSWHPRTKRQQLDESQLEKQLPTPPATSVADRTPPPPIGWARPTGKMPGTATATTPQMTRGNVLSPAAFRVPVRSVEAAPMPLPVDHFARQTPLVSPLSHDTSYPSAYEARTIARDVLIACGRHPHMRHLNAHLEALKRMSSAIDATSDLSTFRWDLVDAGGPPTAPPASLDGPSERPIAPIEVDAEDEDSDNDSVLGPAQPRTAVRQAVGMNGFATFDVNMEPVQRKRGRPRLCEPCFRTHADRMQVRPRHSEGVHSMAVTTVGAGTAAAPSRATLSAPVPSGNTGYAALRQQLAEHSDGQPKKRGRPVGWRKWMMADPSSYKGAARTTPTAKKSPSPDYQIYRCEWSGCNAELHNLATLRAHIFKLHRKANEKGLYECHWKDCGRVKSITDINTGRVQTSFVPHAYPETDIWKEHVEVKHLKPIAWKLGDGPKGGVSDNYESEVSDSYMSDAQGRRITPLAQPPPADSDGAQARKRTAAEREAEQTKAEAEQRKRDIGPAVDRGGAIFINEKRRKGFRDDEDEAMVMDDEDE